MVSVTKSIAILMMLVGCQAMTEESGDEENLGTTEQQAGNSGTQSVKVVNTAGEPVPVVISSMPGNQTVRISQAATFKTMLLYDQQAGVFQELVVPANQRIIVREVNAGVLVPLGTAPTGSLWVAPSNIGTGWQGAYQSQLEFNLVSNFQNVQDRYAAHSNTFLILEPGQKLTWYLTNRAGENAYVGSQIAASISISGEVVAAN